MKLIKKTTGYIINIFLMGIIIGMAVTFAVTGDNRKVEAGKTELVDMQYTFRAIAEEVLPFVVEIMTVEVKIQEMPKGYSWPFNFILPEGEESEIEKQEYKSEGLGSGVIVRQDGKKCYVLTNNHVIGKADKISVRLYDKRIIEAEIVGTDERKDLAMISFETEDRLKTASLGNSDDIYVGDWVLAVGSPLGYESTVTAGIISAIGRSGPEDNISDFIQTDASINQGNSGGALVNLDGEVIGINTWIATTTGTSIGLGFSIPVNNLKNAIDDFIEFGTVKYGWLGVSIADPDILTAEHLDISELNGALVHNVYFDSPAGRAGVQPGDFITGINGNGITDYKHLMRLIADIKAGDIIELEIVRFGRKMKLDAVIELRKDRDDLIGMYESLWPGMTALPIDSEIRRQLGILDSVNGVIISVNAGAAASKAGLKDLDIITAVNGVEINNMLDFYTNINDKSSNCEFLIIRNNSQIELTLEK